MFLLNVVWTLQISYWSNTFAPTVWDFSDFENQVVVCAKENQWSSCQVEFVAKVYFMAMKMSAY